MALAFDIRVGDLNWLFLVYAIAVVVVILFYLFYLSRLLAGILSLILRTILWRRFKVWVDVGSVQFSPLGGRLLFRDVRYVGENESVNVATGSITWRYWLWRVRQDDDLRREDSRLPCRTSIRLEGAEWFIYNRNAAFDMLLERLARREENVTKRGNGKGDTSTPDRGSVRILPPSNENHMKQDPGGIDWFRESLPLELSVIKGAMVMGNRSTPSLVVAGFHSAAGTCGAVQSRSSLDFYKQIYQFTFASPRILFRKNHDYEEPLLVHGARMQEHMNTILDPDTQLPSLTKSRTAFQEILRRWNAFAECVFNPKPRSIRLLEQKAMDWHGLDRYRQAVENIHDKSANTAGFDKQYAKVSTVYDNGDSIDLTYYADVAGYVPERTTRGSSPPTANTDKPDIGNGDLCPEWGVDIRLNGGTLTYGPWSDRQRVAVQTAFFPPAYFNTEPTPYLRPGDRRLHAALKIFVDFSQSITFRLPTREASKDWRYDGRDPSVETSRRPYGWLDMTLGSNSNFSFVLPMTAGLSGFETFLEVHLDSLKISSSINYERFLEAKSCRIFCQLPQPLKWDATHDWKISVKLDRPEIFFLRDHAYLLTDMVRDWTSGEPVTSNRFIPFTYGLEIDVTDYNLRLYLNERNVVDNPTSLEDNTLLSLKGPKVIVRTEIPSDQYQPLFTRMTTTIEARNIGLSMSAPASNTHQAWLTSRTSTFGRVDELQCIISHTMFPEVNPENVETLDIDLTLDGVLFEALGWVIKYLIEIKDNYFGAFNNFTTSAELNAEHSKPRAVTTLTPLQRKHELSLVDIFEVNLNVASRNGIVLLPEELHDCKSGLAMDLPQLTVHLRNHDYYMDLAVNVDPITMVFAQDLEKLLTLRTIPATTSRNRVFLDSFVITAHRLFGPRPLTTTYAAMWTFSLGKLTADVTIPHIASLQRIARVFARNFVDEDNTIPQLDETASLLDVTFLSAHLNALEVNVWSQDSVVVITMAHGLAVKFNDYIAEGALSRLQINNKSCQARGLVQSKPCEWVEVASVDFDLAVELATSSTASAAKEIDQRAFLAEQDIESGRCRFLYDQSNEASMRLGEILHLLSAGSILLNGIHHEVPTGSLFNTKLRAELDPFEVDGRSQPRRRATWPNIEQSRADDVPGSPSAPASGGCAWSYEALLRTFHLFPDVGVKPLRVPTFAQANPTEQTESDWEIHKDGNEVGLMKAYTPSYDDERVTYVQMRILRALNLLCSPKAVQLAEDIVASLEKNFEPEHWVDELDDMFRKALPAPVQPERHESIHAMLKIPYIKLLLVQDILHPGDLNLPTALEGEVSSDASILSTSQLVLKKAQLSILSVQGFHIKESEATQAHHIHDPLARYRSTDGQPVHPVVKRKEFSIRLGKGRLAVKHVGSAANDASIPGIPVSGIPVCAPGTVLEAIVDGLEAFADLPDQYQKFRVQVLDGRVNAVSSAAELVTGSVHSWFIVSRAIEEAVYNAQYRPTSSYRRLVTDILQLAHKEEIVSDPLFLNRPTSAAVHLRSNIDWKILAHVRHVLRRLKQSSYGQLQDSFALKVDAHVDFRNLVSRLQEWHNWELDEMVIRRLSLVRSLFVPDELSPLPQSRESGKLEGIAEESQQTDVELSVTTSHLAVYYFENGQCTNKLALGPVDLYAFQNTKKLGAALLRISVGPLWVELDPGVLRLIVHISRVRQTFRSKLQPLIVRPHAHQRGQKPMAKGSCPGPTLPVRMSFVSESVDVSTYASGVRASFALQRLCTYGSAIVRTGASGITLEEMQLSIGADNTKLLAVSGGRSVEGSHAQESGGTLLSIGLEGLSTHTTYNWATTPYERQVRFLGTIGSSRVRIPRSILKMSQFIEQWRDDSVQESKMAFEALRRDVEQTAMNAKSDSQRGARRIRTRTTSLRIHVALYLPIVTFHIRAAQKFWLDYSIGRMALHGSGVVEASQLLHAQAALNLDSQTINFIAVNDPRLQGQEAPFGGESIHFPAVLLSVQYDGAEVKALASLERIALTLTAGILDSALTVQKRFEHDIDEILAVFTQHKAKRRSVEPKESTPSLSRYATLQWSGQILLRGLNLGLKGPLSTQYIGADLVEGRISHTPAEDHGKTHWEVKASNLALSLAQETCAPETQGFLSGNHDASFNRTYRLAYFVLDIQAGNRVAEVEELKVLTKSDVKGDQQASHLHVKVAKLHAVMRTAAIEALDDLLEHFIGEINSRRKARSTELAAIKEKVILTFDIPEKRSGPRMLPWIERCVLSLRITDVGIAVPLQDVEIEAPFFGHPLQMDTRARPAFLVSTPFLLFATSKGNAGTASISDLSAQFVTAFDQTKARDFSGYHHKTHNRLLLPLSAINIARDAATSNKAKALSINGKMSGAQLDIDGTVPNSVFALIELYEISYKRLARHAPESEAGSITGSTDQDIDIAADQKENDMASFFDATSFEATFEVESGVVRMHSRHANLKPAKPDTAPRESRTATNASPGAKAKPLPHRRKEHIFSQSTQTAQGSSGGSDSETSESFIIPKMTMWSVKKDALAPGKANNLHVNALIHSSRNVLKPTLLPFLSEVSDAIKGHMQKQGVHTAPRCGVDDNSTRFRSDQSPQGEKPIAMPEPEPHGNLSGLRNLCISISLRIDKSRLQLNSTKLAPVSADLDWESGGLMVVLQPGLRSLHASLRVDKVGFSVQHTYSTERCLTGSAHELVFAFSLSPTSGKQTLMAANFDVSSIEGEVNFRQLQDFLCFKAVWLDRLQEIVPLAEAQSKSTPVAKDTKASTSLTTAVLARVQKIKFSLMLGHSIGTIDIDTSMLLGRLRQIPMHSRSFSMDLQALNVSSRGRLAGSFRTDGLYFETYLHDIVHTRLSDLRNCTNISAFLGRTDGSLEFDYRKTLLVRTEPIKVGVIDNWTNLTSANELGLEFSLRFGSFSVLATTQTIPTLVKLGKDMERLIDDRRAKARTVLQSQTSSSFPAKLVPAKIDLKVARENWKAGTILPSAIPEGTKVIGKMELEADRLRFAVFLHHFTDQEAFLADAGEVKAVLSRALDAKKVVVRDLDLHLGFFSVKKMRPKQRVTPAQEQQNSIQDWFDILRTASERNIFKFPTSQATMGSTQEDNSNKIYHRFSLVFTGQVDISLNYALLKQLGALLAAYQDAMKRIGAAETAENTVSYSPQTTPSIVTVENALESDVEGPAKHVPASNIPPPQSVDVVGSREYIALENNIQQPQLQLLGEATPPLEWLGLQRSHAPALVHEGCTLILESALLKLSAVYRRSLSKAASIS